MGCISPLLSSSQKPALQELSSDHNTFCHWSRVQVLVLARKPQPRLHRWGRKRGFFAATQPRSPTACSRLRMVRAARLTLVAPLSPEDLWRSTGGRPGWPAPVRGLRVPSWPSGVHSWSYRPQSPSPDAYAQWRRQSCD